MSWSFLLGSYFSIFDKSEQNAQHLLVCMYCDVLGIDACVQELALYHLIMSMSPHQAKNCLNEATPRSGFIIARTLKHNKDKDPN